MCAFATGGMQMVMVGSVEVVQLNCCVLQWDLTLPSIEMTQTVGVVDVECHGSFPFLLMHLSGFAMFNFATSGILMVMVVNVGAV